MLWLCNMRKPGEGHVETLSFLYIFVSVKLFLEKEEIMQAQTLQKDIFEALRGML